MKLFLFNIALLISLFCNGQEVFEFQKNSKFNSVFNEYNVRPYKSGFLFLSNRKSDYLNETINKFTNEPIYHLYYLDTIKNAVRDVSFSTPQTFDIGAFDVWNDSLLYLTITYSTGNSYVNGLFSSVIKNEVLSAPTPLKINNPDYHIGQPAVSDNGDYLIYVSKKRDEASPSLLKMVNLNERASSEIYTFPSPINTSFSTSYPYLHPSGTLYFCSLRDSTSIDIFASSDFLNDQPTVHKISSQFNSNQDEISFFIAPNMRSGFLSRKERGNENIYSFKRVRPWFENSTMQKKNSYCYTLFDDANFDLDTLPLSYEWTLSPEVKKRGLSVKHCFPGPGMYPIQLNIIDTLTNDIFFSQANYDLEILDIEQPYIECVDTIAVNTPLNFHAFNSFLPEWPISEYHWFVDDSIYFQGPENTHTFKKTGLHKILLGVFTTEDSRGLQATKSVFKNVVVLEEWIPNYASSNEIKTNSSDIFEYISDSLSIGTTIPKETVYRIEILKSKVQIPPSSPLFLPILGRFSLFENYILKDSIYSYSVGELQNLSDAFPLFKTLIDLGFEEALVKAFLPKNIIEFDEKIELKDDQIFNAILRTGAVYFEKNEYKLDASSEAALEKILKLLGKYPQLKIQVSAYTDNSGSAEYNLQLSKKRAKSVVDFFVSKGIPQQRLVDVGFGSTKPVADNQTEEGKRLNRRVEFETINRYE